MTRAIRVLASKKNLKIYCKLLSKYLIADNAIKSSKIKLEVRWGVG